MAVAILGGILDSFVGTSIYMVALKVTPAYEAVPLANTAPFWGVVAAVILLGEEPHFASFTAAILVVLGAYFLASHRDNSNTPKTRWGPWVALLAGVMWGIAEIAPTKYCLTNGMAPVTYQLMVVGGSATAWGLFVLLRYRSNRYFWSRNGLGIAALTGFTNLFLGWILWLFALDRAPASLISPIRGLVVLFGFLASVFILREKPSRRSALGVLLIIGGVVLISIAW
jgi:drug/metabolite transporter (DMT)-like permease